tara:strand:- start:1734 stop:2660 length:927 start_codon:yes stop_codon:yes gene_type:complete
MKSKDYFECICFFVENEIMQITIDQIEYDKNFIYLDYRPNNTSSLYWYIEALFHKEMNKRKFIEKFNLLRKSLNYKPMKYLKNIDEPYVGVLISKKINNQDWLSANKKILKPIIVNNYYIYDENYYSNEKQTLIPIKINASFAFGSGYHETTKNCIHAISLVTRKRQIKNFLDYGSGSGILGICMNKKNQKTKIKYIDNDPTALQITKINVRKNNLRTYGSIFHSGRDKNKYHKKHYYDLVVANILFRPLKYLVKDFSLLLKKYSFLIISGILNNQKNYIINKYRKFNFYIYMINVQNNWVTIIFKKR